MGWAQGWKAGLCVLMFALAAGCGESSDSDTTNETLDVSPSGPDTTQDSSDGVLRDETLAPLPPGTWTTSLTVVPLTFTVDDGWVLDFQGEPGLALSPTGGSVGAAALEVPAALTITTMFGDAYRLYREPMFDTTQLELPIGPHNAVTDPLPDDLTAWLTSIELLGAGQPEPVTVGGLQGHRFDFAVAELPAAPVTALEGGPQVLMLFTMPLDLTYSLASLRQGTMYVLEHERGPILITSEGNPGDELEGFLARADALVADLQVG